MRETLACGRPLHAGETCNRILIVVPLSNNGVPSVELPPDGFRYLPVSN